MDRGTPPPPRPKAMDRNSSRNGSTGSNGEPKIGFWARTSQNIEMAKQGYEQLVHAIIRPPRARYKMEQLGPAEFTFLGQRFRRDDVELLSSNISKNTPTSGEGNLEGGGTPTCSFLKLQASIWTRVNTDGEASPANPYSPTRPKSEEEQSESKTDQPRKKHTMVVYLHGNASARVEAVPNLSFLLAKVGVFGVVGLDFSGSGKSDGDWVSLGYYERVDLECLIQYLKRVYGGPDGTDLEIILWGRSMGASTALMHAGKKSFTAKNIQQRSSSQRISRNNSRNLSVSTSGSSEGEVDADIPDSTTVSSSRSKGSLLDAEIESYPELNAISNASILKGLICDSPFASLTLLCEELVERARAQGIVVPGVVVSVAISMIARSVRKLANFNIREITPIEDVGNIEVPALFVVGADDDFITPHHSERLVEAYKGGVTTNLFMCPGGHNDARPQIVFEGIEEFCKQRLSLDEESAIPIPAALLPTIHANPPWAYHRTVHFQAHSQQPTRPVPSTERTAAETAAEDLGMTQERQDDIQNKIGLMMGGQGNQTDGAESDEEDA